ncbi:MAG: hypothetical protein R2792_07965 [Saprospiraceae bacterium]
MKKALIFSVFLSLLCFTSCKNDDEKIQFEGTSLQTDYEIENSISSGLTGSILYLKDDADFKSLVFQLLPPDVNIDRVVSLIAYTDQAIPDIKIIRKEDVAYLSVFHQPELGKMKHDFFRIDGDAFIKEERFCALTPVVSANHAQSILELIKRENSSLNAYSVIQNYSNRSFYDSPENLKIKLTYQLFKSINIAKATSDRDTPWSSQRCASPCDPNQGCDCLTLPPEEAGGSPEYYCDACVCPFSIVADDVDFPVEYESFFEFEPYYEFRDNFLSNYLIGQKYISYYYALGYFLKTNNLFTTNIIIETAKVSPKVFEIVQKLNSFPEGSSSILITESTKVQLLDLIDKYKALSTNADFHTMLNEISSDIEFYSEKSISQVMEEIN